MIGSKYRWVVSYKTKAGYMHEIGFNDFREFKTRLLWVDRQKGNMAWAQFRDNENGMVLNIIELWESIKLWATK